MLKLHIQKCKLLLFFCEEHMDVQQILSPVFVGCLPLFLTCVVQLLAGTMSGYTIFKNGIVMKDMCVTRFFAVPVIFQIIYL